MSDVALVETLELPFQWDDGQFISPFVRSNESALNSLAVWILKNHIWPAVTHHLAKYQSYTLVNCTVHPELPATLPLPFLHSLPIRQSEQCESNLCNYSQLHRLQLPTNDQREMCSKMRCTHPFTVHFSIVDVGCGDGQALLTLTKSLVNNFTLQLHETHLTDLVTLSLRVTGIDLDEQLIQVAHRNARVFANKVSGVQLCFMCADARTLPPTSQLLNHTVQIIHTNNADNETNQNTQVNNSAYINECTDYTAISVSPLVFLYLLPEALQLLQDYILHCLLHKDEKCLIASNTWPISYLHPWHLTSLNDTIHLYQDTNSM